MDYSPHQLRLERHMDNNLDSVSTNSRLRSIGAFAALLAWAVALVEFGCTPLLWIFDYSNILASHLSTYGSQMPLLLAPDYQPSSLATGLLLVLDMLPADLMVVALVLTGIFFMRLSKGQIWIESNIKMLWWMGLLFIISPLLAPVIYTLQGLALAIDMPSGERAISIDIGISSTAVYEIIQGIFLCAFSLIVAESKAINDENKSII